MKDIVDEALEYDEQPDESRIVTHDEFGPPQFLYIGCGVRGIERLSDDLVTYETCSETKHSPESVLTRVAFQSKSDRIPERSDPIDRYVDGLQTLSELSKDADCCFITADLDEPSALTEVAAVSERIHDCVIIALLTMRTDSSEKIVHQLGDSVGTTVVIRHEDTRFETIESLPGTEQSNTAKLVQRLVTDFIILFTGNNLVGIDYANVWAQWDCGRSAIPFVGRLSHSDSGDLSQSPSISFVGHRSTSPTDWFGYAWLAPSATLADFEYVQESLNLMFDSNTENRCGILGCGVTDELETSGIVSGVQFVESDSNSR